jgi:hypothetical protein
MNLDFPSDLQSNLVELQDYYQRLVEFGSSQLAHINALLQSPNIPNITSTSEESYEELSEEVVRKEIAPTVKKRVKPAIFNASASASTAKVSSKGKVKKTTTATTAKSKPSDMLALNPAYQGQTLLSAIAQVLKSLEGQKVNADTVVKELHGELPPDLLRIAKERVTKNLSKGKIENKWDSVPDQTGLYTFSMSKINS